MSPIRRECTGSRTLCQWRLKQHCHTMQKKNHSPTVSAETPYRSLQKTNTRTVASQGPNVLATTKRCKRYPDQTHWHHTFKMFLGGKQSSIDSVTIYLDTITFYDTFS